MLRVAVGKCAGLVNLGALRRKTDFSALFLWQSRRASPTIRGPATRRSLFRDAAQPACFHRLQRQIQCLTEECTRYAFDRDVAAGVLHSLSPCLTKNRDC